MSLTHVCKWTSYGWKHINAKDAADYCYSTVHAKSGMFMCELCGQYVTFSHACQQIPHFRHNSAEQDKDCEERSKYLRAHSEPFKKESRGLPLRISFTKQGDFEFELGFMLPPNISVDTLNTCSVVIAPEKLEYSLSLRLQPGKLTYLSAGTTPAPSYEVSILPDNEALANLWPETVEGIPESGALFDSTTRKKIPERADIRAGHSYYFLTKKEPAKCYDISIGCKCQHNGWSLYELRASLTPEASRYLWNLCHCWLSDNTAAIIPLWPPHIETPYLLKYDEAVNKPLWFLLQGNAEIKTFPQSSKNMDENLFSIPCSDRQQLLAAGRTKILRYLYIWKDSAALSQETPFPAVMVTDSLGRKITSRSRSELPHKKAVNITPPFDGCALVMNGQRIIERYTLKAGAKTFINGLEYGYSVKIFQGLDMVWEAEYKRPVRNSAGEDESLRKVLETAGGESISVPHTLGGLAAKMKDCPQLKSWLAKCIRLGRMPQKAYKILAHHFTEKIRRQP